ncbi:MAG: hypothetical protein OXF68_13040 [Gammaproteobacteria bacterium]|nr:hypothetical protein [Gammaproteobacteria bacterium]
MTSFQKIPMTFKELEAIIGSSLPDSARRHRPWWSNNPSNSSITPFWLAAGYKTAEVDIGNEQLVFVRDETAEARCASDRDAAGRQDEHPVLGCMAGTVTVPDGVDLTKPAMPEWAPLTQASGLVDD